MKRDAHFVYFCEGYQEWIRHLTIPENRHNTKKQRLTLTKIAKFAGVPPSYLSRVLKREANLNSDQLWQITDTVTTDPNEAAFLQLLLESERCGIAIRKKQLEKQIRELRVQNIKSEKVLQCNEFAGNSGNDYRMAPYYLDPWNQIIHVALTIENLRTDKTRLLNRLGMSETQLTKHLNCLVGLGIIKISGVKISVLKDHLHLPKSSQLFSAWNLALRSLLLHEKSKKMNDQDYSFSVIFSSSNKVRQQLIKKWFELLKEMESLVAQGSEDELYAVNFDFFEINNRI